MRAVLIKNGKGSSDALYIGDTEKPTPKDDEVIVKVVAFGLNRMDISQRDGHYPPPVGASKILGVEFSGVVVELGAQVDDHKVGDEVFGLTSGGAYAEYVAAPTGNVIPKPADLSWVEAAAIPENWITAFQALFLVADLQKGQNILIHAGASGVSIAAAQLAHLHGAPKILTTVSSQAKVDFVKSIPNGVTDAINYKTHDFVAEAKRITNNVGVDVVIDYIGKDYFARNLDVLARDGRMVMLAFLSGTEVPPGTSLTPFLQKRIRVEGSGLRSRSPEYQRNLIKRFAESSLSRFTHNAEAKGERLKVYIHKVYSWKDVKQAHDEMEANNNSGKIILTID